MSPPFRYAYLHGFGSSPLSIKGVRMRERFAERGLELHLPDLNNPSFAKLTLTGALDVLDRLADDLDARHGAGPTWRLIGSSMGGYLSARWAELNPGRVDRLVLLCPGFDLLARWPVIFGERRMRRWEETGVLAVPDARGEFIELWWEFIEDSRRHPRYPVTPCPTLILHGGRDETVPIDTSRRYAAEHDHVRLVELDDDHRLLDSFDRLARETFDFFSIG